MLPYLTANVRFVTRKESNALLIPNAALRWSPSSVIQIAPDARPEKSSNPPLGDGHTETNAKERLSVIWLQDGAFVRPVEVNVGITDGINTAVSADGLQEGQAVVIGEDSGSAQTIPTNPFLPQIRRR